MGYSCEIDDRRYATVALSPLFDQQDLAETRIPSIPASDSSSARSRSWPMNEPAYARSYWRRPNATSP